MAIGERIRFFRNLCGMTQKWLGQVVGFPQKTADIRMAQYESGSRTPKERFGKVHLQECLRFRRWRFLNSRH